MNKYFLDTSVLIADHEAFLNFDSDVIIHITVLEELDKLKKSDREVAQSARAAIRSLDQFSNLGDISVGISHKDYLISVDSAQYDFKDIGDPLYGDNRILASALALHKEGKCNVVVVSNDINLRIKAKSLGMAAEEYNKENTITSDELYSGVVACQDADLGARLLNDEFISSDALALELYSNEFINFLDENSDHLATGRKIKDEVRLVVPQYPYSLKPKNLEQKMAIELLMDKNIDLVTLIGKAGSGKTLLAVAAALELVLNQREHNKIIIFKSVQPIDAKEEIGFLPGTEAEKLAPIFSHLDSAFELLFSKSKNLQNADRWRATLETYMKKEIIEFRPLTYIRGQSIQNAIIIVDEAQNISKNNMKSLLTRAAENTRVFLTGDIEQIDNIKLDHFSNGLTKVVNSMKSSQITGHLTLKNCERSRLTEEVLKFL